jgi:chlorophyll synthase
MQPPIVSTSPPDMTLEKPPVLMRSIGLMKPITWFGPMWAFLCGSIASGATQWGWADIGRILLGMVLAGPILCGISQVMNDYYDREVDAINEPYRLIPSGRVSIQQVFVTLAVLLIIGAGLSLVLGIGVTVLSLCGMILAVLYSAPPVRAKRNGWMGNTVVAFSYEGLAWSAGHVAFASLTGPSVFLAVLYSIGSHGIMSINDFKSIAGDAISGIRTIPVQYGTQRASWIIVTAMDVVQLIVIGAFFVWGNWIVGFILIGVLLAQLPIQRSFIRSPEEQFIRFSAIGVSFFVWGMMAAAIGLRSI